MSHSLPLSIKCTGVLLLKAIGRIGSAFLLFALLAAPILGEDKASSDKANKNREDKVVNAAAKSAADAADTVEEASKEDRPDLARTVSRETFEKLPHAEGLKSILPLLPGIVWDHRDGNPIIDGAGGRENRYFVDGVDTTTILTGDRGMRVHTDFIETVKVSPRGADAAWGGYTGGAVKIVTREGGNQFHGSVGFYYQGSALDGKDRPSLRYKLSDNGAEYVTYPEDTWSRFEPVLTLGGYIIKDRLWFFGGFSPSFTTTERDGSDWPLLGGTIFNGDVHQSGSNVFTSKESGYTGTLKLTGRLSEALRFSAHGALDVSRREGELPPVDGVGWMLDFAEHTTRFPRLALGGDIEYAVGGSFRVRAEVGYFRSNLRESGRGEGPFKLHITSNEKIPGIPDHLLAYPPWYAYVPYYPYRVEKNIETSFSTGLDLGWDFNLGGRHAVNAGLRAVRKGIDKNSGLIEDMYRFVWRLDYERADGTIEPTTYGYVEARDPLGYRYDVHSNGYVLYLQDTWTLGRFSLTLGLRAQQQEIPAFAEGYDPPVRFGFGDTLAPRVAFNWSPLEDGSLRVFGGFGVYYDTPKLEWAEEHFGGFHWISHYYDIADWDWKTNYNIDQEHPLESGLAGGRYLESRNWREPTFETVQPGLKPTGKREFSLGVRKELGRLWTASATFLHHSLFDVIEDIGFLEPDGYSEYYMMVNPGSDWVQAKYEELAEAGLMPHGVEAAKAKRTYSEVTLRLDRKFDRGWLGGLSYTWSRLHGNYDGLRPTTDRYGNYSSAVNRLRTFDAWFMPFTQTGEPTDGPLSWDRTHRVNVYGAYTFDFGLTLGLHGYGMTGTPEQTEIYLNGFPMFYPLGRGSDGRTPFLWQLDLYAEYNLKLSDRLTLQFNADVSNVTDNDMARQKDMLYNGGSMGLFLMDGQIKNGFDYVQMNAEKGGYLDPRYGMEYDYLDAIAARLGIKLMF